MSTTGKLLADRVAIVTGSTKGIGYAIARRLGLDGASIIVSSRKEENVLNAIKNLQMEGINCDGCVAHVANEDDRHNLVNFALQKFGKLDILVSNAAVNPHYGDIMTVEDSKWEKLLSVNVRSSFLLSQMVVPHLEKSGNGNIVFVSSVAGYSPIDGIGAYSVMKSALLGINRTMSQSLASRNIRVNAIAPGIIRTDFSKTLMQDMEQSLPSIDKLIPIGRFGEAEECAGAVSFLVSDSASYMTGETIGVNGGMQARI